MTTDALALPGLLPRAPGVLAGRRRRQLAIQVAGHAVLIALVVISIFPVYWMFVSSLKPENAIFETSLWPAAASLDNYRYVLGQIPMLQMLANTAIVSLVTAFLHVATGLMAGYGFARWRFFGDRFFYGAIALTWLVPFQVTMIPNYVVIANLGLLDTLTGLILPHTAAAFAIILLYQAVRAFPRDVIEAARMDGAGEWRILFQVVMPNLKASLASLAILAFISAWNEYFWPLLLSRKPENSVVQIGLQMFMTQEGNQWGPLMAAATLASLPILIIYVVLQRHVVEAFMRSGLR